MTVDTAHEPLIETASRLEEHRRHSERRTILTILAVVVTLFLFAVVSNLIAYRLISNLISDVEQQNVRQLIALEENRQTAMRNEAAQDRILTSIGDRLVPKAEVRRLERQVILLRRQAVRLQKSVRRLNTLLVARVPPRGG